MDPDASECLQTGDLESQDLNVHLRSSSRVERAAEILGTTLVILILTIPVIITYALQSQAARLGVILLSVVAVAVSLQLLTLARRMEVFAGTAT